MTAAVAPVLPLLISVALLLMGNGLQGTLLPVRANLESFGAFGIGILGACYFFGFALGCLNGPHLVRRAGHIRAFAAIVSLASCVVLLHVLVVSPLSWWIMRATTGYCFAVLFMVIESWLNEKSSNENRGLIFAIYTCINLTVVTVGQLMLILDDPLKFPLFAIASILVSLSAVPIALTKAAAPQPIETVKIRLRHLYKLSPVGVVGCLAVGMGHGSFWALGPLFAQGEGTDTDKVALFMSIVVFSGALGQWPIGRFSDRMDRRKVITFSCLAAATAAIAMVTIASGAEFFLFAALFGFFFFPLYALSIAHTNDYVDPEGYVEAASGLLLVFALGATTGPLVASVVIRFAGLESLFLFIALVLIGTAGFALYRMTRRASAPVADQMPFNEALLVAGTVSTIDPLSPGEEDESSSGEPPAGTVTATP